MKKLSWTQRIALAEGIKAGKSNAQIAREIGVHRSTVGREIARNADSRESYAPQEADLRCWYRQKEAMPRRFLITFCGVEFYTQLQKRNRIYTYISRTHLNTLSRQQDYLLHAWDGTYRQLIKNRFMTGHAFMHMPGDRFPAISVTQGVFRSQNPKPSFPHSFSDQPHPRVSAHHLFKPLVSGSSGRMPGPAVSGFEPAVSSPKYQGEIIDKLPVDACHSLGCSNAKILGSLFLMYWKQNSAEHVIFLSKIKNHTKIIAFNLLKKRCLAVKN